ncbi:MAG: hypothetical protein ABSC92_07320 [Rhizomicrobium sp.]|jgi:hypothetical protein
MTDTYISTTMETTATGVDTFEMTGTNDTLFLAGTGSLVALGVGSIGFKIDAGHDTIAFSSADFTSFAELQTHMTQVGTSTVITLEPGSTIELHHVIMTHLSAADFTFG